MKTAVRLDQRFYTSQFGRFLSADRFKQAAKANDSGSWNKYSCTRGDPVNRTDPLGTCDEEENSSGCDDPPIFDPTRYGPVTVFGRARDRLYLAENALADRSAISIPCLQDLQKIDSSFSADQRAGSALQVFDIASTENILNGIGSTDPISDLYANPQAGRGAQAEHPGWTIGDLFSANPQGLTAESVLGAGTAGTIYINGSLISGNLQQNEALLLHEALHSLGFDDTGIQTALGITVDSKNTRNITDKLLKDCVTGKGNN